jgi:hypothetical protein
VTLLVQVRDRSCQYRVERREKEGFIDVHMQSDCKFVFGGVFQIFVRVCVCMCFVCVCVCVCMCVRACVHQ